MSTRQEKEIAQLSALIEQFSTDIPLFAKTVFDCELTPKQQEFCEAFRNNRQITFKGGVGFGKTFCMGIIVYWSLICHDEIQVSIFGPNEGNLKNGIWKELLRLQSVMTPLLKDAFEITATRISRRTNPASCFAEMRLANKDNISAARGIHSRHNFILCDEASGIDDVIFTDALLNIMTDPNPKLCLVSNPSHTSGFFYRTWMDDDICDAWVKVHGRLQDSPHYDPATFDQIARNYGGPTSRQYRVMVDGEFPLSDEEGLIPRDKIDIAVRNEDCVPVETVFPIWGVDPAGLGGDSSVLCIRHDNVLKEFKEWNGLDPVQLAYKIRDEYERTPKKDRPAVICVDATGLGHGVHAALKDWGLPVQAVIFAGTPLRHPERYVRVRDELWGEMRNWLITENVSIPNHKKLIEELATPKYEDQNGKMKIEDKKAIKKRLRRSPDFADALAITFAASKTRFSSKYDWSKPIEYPNLSSYE